MTTVGLLALLAPAAPAQPPLPLPPARPIGTPRAAVVAPPGLPAPVLAARVLAPPGVRVTALPGTPLARAYPTPATLALRPGYVYRFELSNLPLRPGRVLYPEVEVRGTLVPRGGMRYMDFPAALQFTTADIDRVVNGGMVTKFVYLEDPEKAAPAATRPDEPLEIAADNEERDFREALDNGRLVAVVRLGDKVPTADELLHTAVDGTVLLPGENYLKTPAAPPCLPWLAVPLFDPILGPKGAAEECILDGGDRGDRMGIGPGRRLGGFEPTEVSAEYTSNGKRRVTTSNVVCICSPRFVARRAEVVPVGYQATVGLQQTGEVVARVVFRERLAPVAAIVRERPVEFASRIRPMAVVVRVGTDTLVWETKPVAFAQVQGIKVVGAVVEPLELTGTGCPLTVSKEVDPPGPVQVGDEVTVTIRYRNTGANPADDVVLSDSLSGRLEYVTGSAQTDRAANFTAAENAAGSVVVRWELPGTLLPGQGGAVRFRARVR